MADDDEAPMSEQELRDFAKQYPKNPLSEQIRQKYGMSAPNEMADELKRQWSGVKQIGTDIGTVGTGVARGLAQNLEGMGRVVKSAESIPYFGPGLSSTSLGALANTVTSQGMRNFADAPLEKDPLQDWSRTAGQWAPFLIPGETLARLASKGLSGLGGLLARGAAKGATSGIVERGAADMVAGVEGKASNWNWPKTGLRSAEHKAQVEDAIKYAKEKGITGPLSIFGSPRELTQATASISKSFGPQVASRVEAKLRDPGFLDRFREMSQSGALDGVRRSWLSAAGKGAVAGAIQPGEERSVQQLKGAEAGVVGGALQYGLGRGAEMAIGAIPHHLGWVAYAAVGSALATVMYETGMVDEHGFHHPAAMGGAALGALPFAARAPGVAGAIAGKYEAKYDK